MFRFGYNLFHLFRFGLHRLLGFLLHHRFLRFLTHYRRLRLIYGWEAFQRAVLCCIIESWDYVDRVAHGDTWVGEPQIKACGIAGTHFHAGRGREALAESAQTRSAPYKNDTARQISGLQPGIFYLLLDIGYYLTRTSRYILLHGSDIDARSGSHVRFNSVIGIAHTLLYILGLLLYEIKSGKVAGNVARSHGDSRQILQGTILIYWHGCGLGTAVNEHAAQTHLLRCEHKLGLSSLTDNESIDIQPQLLVEQTAEILLYLRTACYDIWQHAYVAAKRTDRLGNTGLVNDILTRHNVQKLAVVEHCGWCLAHKLIYDVSIDFCFLRQHALSLARIWTERTSAHGHVDALHHKRTHTLFKAFKQIGGQHSHFLHVAHYSVAHPVLMGFLLNSLHGDGAGTVNNTDSAFYLGTAYFQSHNVSFLHICLYYFFFLSSIVPSLCAMMTSSHMSKNKPCSTTPTVWSK